MKPCQLNPQTKYSEAGNRKRGKRRHHHVSGAMRSPQSHVDERQPGRRKGVQKDEENAGNGCYFRESSEWA